VNGVPHSPARPHAAEPAGDVGIPAQFAEIAIAHDIDARIGLLSHDFGDRSF
jgi:hypothetical protein